MIRFGGTFWYYAFIALLVAVFIANLAAASLLVSSAKHKQPSVSGGWLWFIGLFGSALMLGLVVCAMPDERLLTVGAVTLSDGDELPDL